MWCWRCEQATEKTQSHCVCRSIFTQLATEFVRPPTCPIQIRTESHHNELWLEHKPAYQMLVAKQSLHFIWEISFISLIPSYKVFIKKNLYKTKFTVGFVSTFCVHWLCCLVRFFVQHIESQVSMLQWLLFISHSIKLLHPSSQSGFLCKHKIRDGFSTWTLFCFYFLEFWLECVIIFIFSIRIVSDICWGTPYLIVYKKFLLFDISDCSNFHRRQRPMRYDSFCGT